MSRADDILRNEGLVRTDMSCHFCSEKGLPSTFIARIDFDLNGNHVVKCPRCGHSHYRKIVDGKVTSDRYDSDSQTHVIEGHNVWASGAAAMVTSTAAMFLRDRWLRREDA